MPVEVGSIVEGVVTGITNFGAFVTLPGGETGLVHISEIANSYVRDIHDHLKKSDLVKVKVLSVDGGKIGLSIRQALPGSRRRENRATFEDKLARFMKESDERLQDLKRNTESKRGGRGTYREAY
ncbi:MAG TPA: S1 RNA-binding domain-containing protein [Bacillota bacterium]|jgi:S1 RNA binding domain protein|nr:S1 RNA-binding domain-containing protein [Bacillota bacterium]HOA34894.1 S1 RNA-binding domain-containing protein [Bacillota bacterium]HOJ84192.1 S1 RNA-binding domain-containing protein [Bacillota bacterium]HOL14604.1 S1 RNA-binding domain-containing protein [Bacillota bacterium]HPZ10766.1 S1 RNA-binding domain-containing protein [Bacillota bacterium]